MAEQHMGSLLPIKNRVIEADKNTTFLAHYDLNANDVLSGIEPIGSTQSLQFNGGSNYIDTPLAITASTGFTVMAHICPSSGHAHILTQYITNEGLLIQNTSGNALQIYINEMSSLNYSWAMGVWYHVAVTHSNNKATLYVDGIKIREVAVSNMVWPNYPLRIGNSSSALNRGFNGKLRSVGVFKKALSENEINLFMRNNYSIANDSLIGLWKMDEGYGSVIKDSSGLHNDAVIPTGTTWSTGETTYTLLPKEGRFGGGVAVEEGTTNMFTHPDLLLFSGYTGVATTQINEPTSPTGKALYLKAVGPSINPAARITPNKSTLSTTGKYTLSVYAKGVGSTIGKSIRIYTGTEWVALTDTLTESYKRFVIPDKLYTAGGAGIGLTSLADNDEWYLHSPQLEEKPFATSFTYKTREAGSLGYPPGSVDWTKPWTISLWLKFNATNTVDKSDCVVWGAGVNVKDKGLHILRRSSGYLALAFAGNDLNATRFTDDAFWHYYCFVWDGTSQIIYEDGIEIGKRVTNKMVDEINTYPHGPNMFDNKTRSTNAIIDEVRIDQIARTPDEIMAWYFSNSPFYPRGIYRSSY